MVLLIGGSSHVGKTFLAQKLMERLNYPYLSLDHLKMGLIRTKITHLTVEDDYEMRYFLWPIAAEMVKTVIENEQNLIVEGCYIPGEWRDWLDESYLEHIRCTFIVMSEGYLRQNFGAVAGYADIIEKRLCDEPDPERLIRCSKMFKEECARFHIDCLEIDGEYDTDKLTDELMRRFGL